jgi:hypothetical protein
VEIVIPAATPAISVVEPLLEGIFFEDLPNNLLAVKAEIERVAAGPTPGGQTPGGRQSKPRLAGMMKDFALLRAELEATYGASRVIPSRAELRASNRTDLEKALAAHGGASMVAGRMGWTTSSRSRKPRGYWNSLDNLKTEIDEFLSSSDLPPRTMPLKSDFVRAGRFDLARAVEKWGGMYDVADQLGYDKIGSSSAKRPSPSSGDYILSSVDLDDMMHVMTREESEESEESEERETTRFSMPSARDEIDAW